VQKGDQFLVRQVFAFAINGLRAGAGLSTGRVVCPGCDSFAGAMSFCI
jgi:hypothetical protein